MTEKMTDLIMSTMQSAGRSTGMKCVVVRYNYLCTSVLEPVEATDNGSMHLHYGGTLVPRSLSFFCVGVGKERIWWISVCGFM